MKAIINSRTALSVVSALVEEPDTAREARLGSTGAMMEDRPEVVGPAYVVFTGVDVERGLRDEDLVLSVEGFDAHPVLAPCCHDAIVRMRREYEGTVSYLRAATNQFHLNRMALDMRLMTLGLLDPCDDFTQSSD
ncbi:MAG: hypothetical protein IAE82_06560 [Opitutaceae bacterium]|nr:hypothetical protein [Opitutaceae bacterium]